ncbi:hypothetical protein CK489_15440 [Bradyrhizobium sp. UFLA03-84]|nr:hypothetical protein CK489_15440 [Bradyrhizobium sp. UFLA03-84]
MLQDQAASGQLKYATVSSIASAGSVSSIGSLTGAFTIDGGNLSSNVLPFPRNDVAQSWSSAQQKQARQNIGADSGVLVADRNGTNQTGLTAASNNKIQFNNKVKDANGWFDAVTNYRYTPLIAGTYLVSLNVLSNNGTSGETCQALIYKNGSSVKVGPYFATTGSSSYQSQIVAALTMNGTTDYLEFYIYVPATITTLNGLTSTTNVQVWRIGD